MNSSTNQITREPAAVRNKAVDLIKLIACICVVCLHTVNPRLGPIHKWVYHIAWCAIPLFMMATGYFLFQKEKEKVTQSYIVTKILGIFRFCYAWGIIFMACTIGILLIKEQDYVTAIYLAADYPADVILCMLQDGTLGVTWFCGALVLLYLFAYVYYQKNMRAHRVWLYAFLVGFCMQVVSCVTRFSVRTLFRETFCIWCWLQYAMLGAMMPRINRKLQERVPLWAHGLLMVLVIPLVIGFQMYCADEILDTILPLCFYDSISMILEVGLIFSFILRLPQKAFSRINPAPLAALSIGVFPLHIWVYRVLLHLPLPFLPADEGRLNFVHFFLTIVLSFGAMYVVSRTRLKNYFLKL